MATTTSTFNFLAFVSRSSPGSFTFARALYDQRSAIIISIVISVYSPSCRHFVRSFLLWVGGVYGDSVDSDGYLCWLVCWLGGGGGARRNRQQQQQLPVIHYHRARQLTFGIHGSINLICQLILFMYFS